MALLRALKITKTESDAINRILKELKYLEKKPLEHKNKIKELANIIAHHTSYHSTMISLKDCPPITQEEERILKQAEIAQNNLRKMRNCSVQFRFYIPNQSSIWKTLNEMKAVSNSPYTRIDLEELDDHKKNHFREQGVTSIPPINKEKLAQQKYKTYLEETHQIDENIRQRAIEIKSATKQDIKEALSNLRAENRRACRLPPTSAAKPSSYYTAKNVQMTLCNQKRPFKLPVIKTEKHDSFIRRNSIYVTK